MKSIELTKEQIQLLIRLLRVEACSIHQLIDKLHYSILLHSASELESNEVIQPRGIKDE